MAKPVMASRAFVVSSASKCGRTFREYAYLGRFPHVKQRIVEMTLNGSGIRGIARVLWVGPNTAIRELKKAAGLSPVTQSVVEGCCPDAVTVEVRRVEAAEVDERWSVVQSQAHQRWVWQAIDHVSGVGLAYYAFGRRADKGFLKFQQLLKSCELATFTPMRQQSMSATSRPRLILRANSTRNRLNVNV